MKFVDSHGEKIFVEEQWRGHEFSDAEIDQMMMGENISFESNKKDGGTYTNCGTYQDSVYNGIPCKQFVPKGYELVVWMGDMEACYLPLVNRIQRAYVPSKEDMNRLLSGEIIDIVKTNTKGETEEDRVHIYWDGQIGSRWLVLARYNPNHAEISRQNQQRYFEELRVLKETNSVKPLYLKLRPSDISKYFEYSCDRYIAFSSIEDKNFKGNGENPDVNFAASAGDSWEKDVYHFLSKYYDCVSFEDEAEVDTCTADKLMTAFDETDAVRFIYQAQFQVQDTFMGHKNADSQYLKALWSVIKPDFIMVEHVGDENRISIIDVKLAQRPRISHKMQVALYTMLLNQFMKEYCDSSENRHRNQDSEKSWKIISDTCFESPSGKKFYINTDYGYLWNFTDELREIVSGSTELNPSIQKINEHLEELKKYLSEFSQVEAKRYLYEFLDLKLPSVMDKISKMKEENNQISREEILKNLDFCIGTNCCGNCENCVEWGNEMGSVQLYPYISRRAQQFIVKLANNTDRNLLTIDGMREFMVDSPERSANKELLRSNFSWKKLTSKGKMESMLMALSARRENKSLNQDNISDDMSKDLVASMQLPKEQDVALFLTLQNAIDCSGEIVPYAYGIYVKTNEKAKDILDSKYLVDSKNHIYYFSDIASQMCYEQEIGLKFIHTLYEIIESFWQYNTSEFTDGTFNKITLQGYVFDQYEFDNIQNLLFEELNKIKSKDDGSYMYMDFVDQIYNILFWLQGDRITSELEKHPKEIIAFPVVVLSNEIQQLYEIPAYVTMNLWNACKALTPESDFEEESKKYCMFFSNKLRLDAFYDEKAELRDKEAADRHILSRLEHEYGLLEKIQKKETDRLYHHLSRFEKPNDYGHLKNMYVSGLLYESSNEFYLKHRRERTLIVRNPASAIASGQYMTVTFNHTETTIEENRQVTRLVCEINQQFRTGKVKPFEAYVLKADGLLEQSIDRLREIDDFNSLENDLRERGFIASNFGYRGTFPDKVTFVMQETPYFNENTLREGETFIIIEKASSLNHGREQEGLIKIGNDQDKVKLLQPELFSTKHSLVEGCTGEKLIQYGKINDTNFVDAQEDVFKHVCDNKLTLLQGPPGTGKTDFIARLLVALCRGNTDGKPLRVLISGFSHAAINNALRKTYEKATEAGLDENSIKFYKDKRGQNKSFQIGDIAAINQLNPVYKSLDNPENAWKKVFQQEEMVVVGATCWACYTANPFFKKPVNTEETEQTTEEQAEANQDDIPCFDLIIIDEASQMTVTQGLLAMAYGNPGKTHYLIVGDNHQLPPIIYGNYETHVGKADLYHSVFQFYMDKMKEIRNRLSENDELKKLGVTEDVIESTNYVKMLYSNFRMNEALSDYSAQKIYNNQKDIPNPKHLKYSGYNEAIRNQVLRLKENWREDLEKNHSEIADWAKQVLNPEYPFVVIYLSNAAADKMSELERQMVSDITYLLQKYMVKADGSLYFDLTNLPQATHSFWGTNGAEDVQAEEHPAFGILSPYHEQIEALKKRIAKDMEERYADFLEDGNQKIDSSNFLVDTVNKLQGQEREAIVVSYGVDDVEKAIEQGEFIYSYQRLNVSLTRGKKKTILFLTDALTDYPIEMLDSDNQELLKGVSFMCDMRDYFESDEPEFESEKYSFKEPDNEVTIDIYRRRHKS